MTLDELFPREQFPVRVQTQVQFPEKNVVVRIRIFYQNPFGKEAQNFGAKFSLLVEGKKPWSCAAGNLAKVGEEEFYCQGENGDFSLVSGEELDKLLKEAGLGEYKKYLMKVLCGDYRTNCKWEQL